MSSISSSDSHAPRGRRQLTSSIKQSLRALSIQLSLLNHHAWFPVPVPVIERCGPLDQRGNRWTRPENFVGNGPFVLAKWKINDVLQVKKSATYWDN